jgi:hypothetical protein
LGIELFDLNLALTVAAAFKASPTRVTPLLCTTRAATSPALVHIREEGLTLRVMAYRARVLLAVSGVKFHTEMMSSHRYHVNRYFKAKMG